VVDKALIYRKVSELELCLKQMQEFSALSADGYRNDWKIQRIVERTLQMMIETCADVASHIVSDRGMRTPQAMPIHSRSFLKTVSSQRNYV
jgi:uncharacterized protein YutE (UPF0331/DUF86 family)